MTKVVRLNETDLFNIVNKVLNKRPIVKRKETFIEKLDNLLEFHIKLHKGLYNVNGDSSFLKKKQNDYINNLFPYNHRVIKESRNRFSNKLLAESDDNYINDFFGFIRENFIKEYGKKRLTEQQQQQQNQQQQKTQLAKKAVIPLAQSLMKAFDGWGTDEELAVQTIKKIKSKEEVYELDLLLKSWKKGSLKDYINGDMSDFDSTEYRAIWAHLGKFGVTGANFNNALAALGKGDIIGAIGAGWNWLKTNGIGWLMGKIRSFLDSGWGAAAQIFLDSFGVGAIGVALVWGIMVIWDLINVTIGGWGMLLLSIISLLTVGALGPYMAPIAKVLKPIKGGLGKVIEKLMSTKLGQGLIAWIPKIGAGLSKVGGWIKSGVQWLVTKFGKYLPKNISSLLESGVNKAVGWCENVVKNLTAYSKHEAADTVLTSNLNSFPGMSKLMDNPKWASSLSRLDKPTAKIVDKYIHDNVRKYGWEAVEKGICKKYGQIACQVADKVGLAFQLRKSVYKVAEKGASVKDTDLTHKTADELANMTADELKAFKTTLGANAQKVVKDTQKAGKAIGAAVDVGSQIALGSAVDAGTPR